jgi:hypothetical protein
MKHGPQGCFVLMMNCCTSSDLQEKSEDVVQNAIRALLPRDYPESVRQGYKG